MTKLEVLQKYFGHKAFRGGQEPLVDCILGGGDCLGVMPTGAGKSVCFQVPALMLGGTTIVISPLISLMQDQVTSLVQNGVEAACINSTMSSAEYSAVCRMAEQGQLKLLYVAPERLETEGFVGLCSRLEIPLVAVDEAHCVSHWGQDFRPSYLKIARFVQNLSQNPKKRPTVAAFTATATDAVKDDIIRLLELREPFSLTTGFDRPNLYFEVREPDDKEVELLDILRGSLGSARSGSLGSGSAIVYCSTRKNVEKVTEILTRNGISAGGYHAGMSKDERARIQDDFIYDRLDVIVATNAFGMGIDKSNVSLVVHYNMPKDLESYYQEAGRAGRDGGAARCIMLYGYDDVKLAEFMINAGHEDENIAPKERNELLARDFKRLRVMQGFAKTRGCLREYILSYFGEKTAGNCSNCGNCAAGFEAVDVTVEAQKILSCIYRLKQRSFPLGRVMVGRILLGSKDKRLSEWGLTSLSTYGIMRGESRERLREIMDKLEAEGYFEERGDRRVCVLTPKADEFIKSGQRFIIHISHTSNKLAGKSEKPSRKSTVKADAQHQNPELFERLRELRRMTASALGVPPYVVFSDSALWSMCAILPRDQAEFLTVSGVGTMKAERYGRIFVAEITKFIQDDKTRTENN